jgi:hypothetical protein
VIGWLTNDEVLELLERIKNLWLKLLEWYYC